MTGDRGVRIAFGIIGALVMVNLLGAVLTSLGGGGPSGPAGSSTSTSPSGLAAYAELLARGGHRVEQLRDRLDEADLEGVDALVVLEAPDLETVEARAAAAFVEGGGRLVAGGEDPVWIGHVVDDPPAWVRGGGEARPLAPVPEVDGVMGVETYHGRFRGGAPLPVLGDGSGDAVAMVARVGAGRVVLLADASPLSNAMLAAADNARFGLTIAGPPGVVAFAEAHHLGPGDRGLAAVPVRWRWLLAGLGLAALAWIASRARRLGPPQDRERRLPPARRRYVDAMAAALARTKRPAQAVAPVRRAAMDAIARRAGLGGDDLKQLRAAAIRLGLEGDEIDAVLGDAGDDETLLALGRALARSVAERPLR